MKEPHNTMIELPVLKVSDRKNFIGVLHDALSVGRKHGVNVTEMMIDVQSQSTIEERKKRLEKWFTIV